MKTVLISLAALLAAQGAPAEVVTEALVHELYGVTCTLVPDPATGTPILTDLRRA